MRLIARSMPRKGTCIIPTHPQFQTLQYRRSFATFGNAKICGCSTSVPEKLSAGYNSRSRPPHSAHSSESCTNFEPPARGEAEEAQPKSQSKPRKQQRSTSRENASINPATNTMRKAVPDRDASAGSDRVAKPSARWTRAHIAFGSNMGNTVQSIEKALKMVEADSHGTVKVLRTSRLWRTKAMYVLDQADFVNGVCEIDTCLPPENLLSYLQSIENSLGRVKVVDKGPRCIDLDILLYGNETVQTDRLTIPHALMLEREFVLRPLSELIPDKKVPHPLARGTVQQHLSWLPPSSPSPVLFFPLFQSLPPLLPLDPTRSTLVMSILNTTPDSFSTPPPSISSPPTDLDAVLECLQPHTHILDIGGQSTRPGASLIDPETELSRLRPALGAVTAKKCEAGLDFPAISVDTFHSAVADAALSAGADMINDVTGGTFDPKILSVVAKHDGAIVLTHSRGTVETMHDPAHRDYSRPFSSASSGTQPSHSGADPDAEEKNMISVLAHELRCRIDAAEAAGIRKWKIMLDPGFGFGKSVGQNVAVLRRLGELRAHPAVGGPFPWLVGTSRKGFVGTVTGRAGEPAAERRWGTAASVAAAVAGGADVVRVHEPREMGEVVKMADAVWRGWRPEGAKAG